MTDMARARAARLFGRGTAVVAASALGVLMPVTWGAPALAGSFTVAPVAPVAPPAHVAPIRDRWDGHYAGITLGYGFHGRDRVGLRPPSPPDEIGTLRVRGALLGVQLGANWQHGRFVYGIEGGANLSYIRDSFDTVDGHEASMRINPVGEVRGRLGFAHGDTLLYAAGGLSAGRVRYAVSGPASLPPDADIASTFTQFGWNLGLGVEHAINRDWSVRGEYSYTDLGGRDLSDGTYTTRATPNFHSIRIGINRSF